MGGSTVSGRRRRTARWIAAPAALLLVVTAHPARSTASEAPPATRDIELLIHEINLARWDPPTFAAGAGVDMSDVLPRPPLAPNRELIASAQFKADEIATYGYFAHQSAVTGMWPNELAKGFGYGLPELFASDANNIESLHGGSPIPTEVLGSFAASPTHRRHVFGQGWFFSEHREIGVGLASGANIWAVHTGYREGSGTFATGVVFSDDNGNGHMDLGEGLGGVTVTTGTMGTLTDGGGGYSLPLSPGRYEITARGGPFEGEATASFTIGAYNVGIDFESGRSRPTVRAYRLCHGRPPTIVGTSRRDILIGTPGDDVIHGLGGNDTIKGMGGDDLICGGSGRDTIYGNGGDDVILGGGGFDAIRGGAGHDIITGGAGRDGCQGASVTRGCEAG